MIALKTPMAALRAHRQAGYTAREIPAYLCLGGSDEKAANEPQRGPRIVKIESSPLTADQETR